MKKRISVVLILLMASPFAVFASSGTDKKIEDAANSSYNYKTVLDGNVKARAEDGVVTLTGTVDDKDQADIAVDTAKNLPGVVSVKNEIKVESKYAEKSDGWIALKIRGLLLVKANVSITDTDVKVNNGNVLLTGNARNDAQKELTAQYAKSVEGVRSVKNDIVVREQVAMADNSRNDADRTGSPQSETIGEKIDDASITTQVKFALAHHKSTSALKTKVDTDDGVVHITGNAANDSEKSLVSKLASDVRGVKSVENEMTVGN